MNTLLFFQISNQIDWIISIAIIMKRYFIIMSSFGQNYIYNY